MSLEGTASAIGRTRRGELSVPGPVSRKFSQPSIRREPDCEKSSHLPRS